MFHMIFLFDEQYFEQPSKNYPNFTPYLEFSEKLLLNTKTFESHSVKQFKNYNCSNFQICNVKIIFDRCKADVNTGSLIIQKQLKAMSYNFEDFRNLCHEKILMLRRICYSIINICKITLLNNSSSLMRKLVAFIFILFFKEQFINI